MGFKELIFSPRPCNQMMVAKCSPDGIIFHACFNKGSSSYSISSFLFRTGEGRITVLEGVVDEEEDDSGEVENERAANDCKGTIGLLISLTLRLFILNTFVNVLLQC